MIGNTKRVSDLHDELFHYTTVSAFENIFNSRSFWATHYENLNDSSELQLFRRKLEEFIRPVILEVYVEKGGIVGNVDAAVDREVAMKLDGLHRNTFGERRFQGPFICSFCTHHPKSDEANHGLLSQWRGYGADGGVAIVLDTRGVEELLEYERCIFAHPVNHIGNVIYDDGEADAKIRNDFPDVVKYLPKLVRSFYSERDKQDPPDEMLHQFIYGTTLIKHCGFREEQEVRIVVSPSYPESIFYDHADPKPMKTIRYRRKGDCEIQYIELFGVTPLPIKRVIVGPSRFQNLNHQRINELLKGSEIKVVKSNIPFLG